MKNAKQPGRHGDVLFVKAEIPADAKPVKPHGKYLVLAWGEATGHAHVIDKSLGELFEKDGVLYLKVEKEAPVKHVHMPSNTLTKDHRSTETLPKGAVKIVIQQETQPDGMVRPVID